MHSQLNPPLWEGIVISFSPVATSKTKAFSHHLDDETFSNSANVAKRPSLEKPIGCKSLVTMGVAKSFPFKSSFATQFCFVISSVLSGATPLLDIGHSLT